MIAGWIVGIVAFAPQDQAPESRPKAELDKNEQFIVGAIDPERCKTHLRALTKEAHVAGTPADQRTVAYVKNALDEAGFATSISEYHVLLSYPKRVALAVIAPVQKDLDLREQPSLEILDEALRRASITYNAYSASGTIEGEIVYANLGRIADFAWLAEQGIDLHGKICLIRYGGQFRGLKVQEAERAGAAGVLLYSDPDDDGYRNGDAVPDGPWRPDTGVQRGSIQYISTLVGDPLTPGRPALQHAERLPRDKAPSLPRILCLPISWGNAGQLFAHLRGKSIPKDWQGGCPHTYHSGPGPVRVRMTVELEEKIAPIWNVHGTLPGTDTDGRYVMIGNHRDSWVHGAIDPSSGSAVSLEAMRALGALAKSGWKPRLSIRYSSWDGEEFGLLGSVEWVEDHADEIRQKCLAYFNCDAAVGGDRLDASATPDLVELLAYATARVDAHDGKGRVLTRWAHGGTRPPVTNLGSGSDFTAFVARCGISCFDLIARGGHGVYHSVFDDIDTMERFIDPGYRMHATMSRVVALATLRFASAATAPLDSSAWAPHLRSSVEGLPGIADQDKQRLLTAIDALAKAKTVASDDRQIALHGAFVDPAGIASRPWFQNLFVAPGRELGYGAVVLPALTEALLDKNQTQIAREVERLVLAIGRAKKALSE